MSNQSVKVVRPWPAEQPRPPVVHHTESARHTAQDRPANRPQDRATQIAD